MSCRDTSPRGRRARRPRQPTPAATALAFAWAAVAGAQLGAQVGPQGSWSAPFDHEVNTANTNQLVIPMNANNALAFIKLN